MPDTDPDDLTEPTPAFDTRLPTRHAPRDGDLTWAPAWHIRDLIATKQVSPVEVVDHFLSRMDTLDPHLHAMREVDVSGAREAAQRAEAAVARGDVLGPLHGVPVAAKELLAIEGRLWTHSLLGRVRAERDSVEIERLRSAGAVIVGPTVAGLFTGAFGGGESEHAPRNPWDPGRVCGGSSGGSACALSAGMAPLTIGGDGYGSTRLPAAFCGVVGVHPTRGRVPSFDWASLSTRPLTTYGPMARDVRDAATALSVMAGPDGRDLMCLQDDPPDYLADLETGVKGFRLAWSDDLGYAKRFAVTETPRVIEATRLAALRLCEAGAEIDTLAETLESPIWAGNQWVASDAGLSSDNPLAVGRPSIDAVFEARATRSRLWEAMRKATTDNEFILTPTVLEIAPTRADWADHGIPADFSGIYLAMTAIANVLGWPAMSIPAGLVDGMPVGLQILGRPNSEPRMFQLANALLAVPD